MDMHIKSLSTLPSSLVRGSTLRGGFFKWEKQCLCLHGRKSQDCTDHTAKHSLRGFPAAPSSQSLPPSLGYLPPRCSVMTVTSTRRQDRHSSPRVCNLEALLSVFRPHLPLASLFTESLCLSRQLFHSNFWKNGSSPSWGT